MKKLILLLAIISFAVFQLTSQTIEHFESLTMIIFSGGTNGAISVIPNPETTGINTSGYVGKMIRGFDGDPWAGWYATMATPVDVTANKYVHLKIWKPRISPVVFKYEGPNGYSGDVYSMNPQTLEYQWEELVFDMSVVSGEYVSIVLIPDFESPLTLTEDITLYYDDLYVNNDPTVGSAAVQVMENFEPIPLNLLLGGDEDFSMMAKVQNPDISGCNLSNTVIEFLRDKDGVPWGGFWSDLPSVIDLTINKYIHVKVWKPRISPIKFKIEGGVAGTIEIESMYPQTLINEWEDIVFDFSEKTGEYPIITFLPDFMDPVGLTEDIIIYFDDIILNNDPAPFTSPSQTISVNMTESGMVTGSQVWISGTMGGIYGTWDQPGSNPNNEMTDLDGDGIYSVTLSLVPEQTITFKFFWGIGWNNGDPAPAGDRILYLEQNMNVLYKWGVDGIFNPQVVIFSVNMEYQTVLGNFNPDIDFVDIAGTFNSWNGINHHLSAVGNDLYSISIDSLDVGETIEFKYRINGDWNTCEFPNGGPNRTYTVHEGINKILVWYNDDPLPMSEITVTDFENETSGPLTLHVMGCGDWDNEQIHPVSETFQIVENPHQQGLNKSQKVMKFNRRGTNDGGMPWGGFWAECNPNVDISLNKYIHVLVWKPKISPLRFKMEGGYAGTLETESMNQQPETEKWVDMVFDYLSLTGDYPIIAFMPDYEDPLTSTDVVEIYFDNIRMNNDPEPYQGLLSDFSASVTNPCEGSSINFELGISNFTIDSVRWEFQGGNPSSSVVFNPIVEYLIQGEFDVSLTAYGQNDSVTNTKNEYIQVVTVPPVPNKPMGETLVCFSQNYSVYSTNTTLASWELTPTNAGDIYAFGAQCEIYWEDAFEGQASLKAKAVNSCGESAPSEALVIEKTEGLEIEFNGNIIYCYGKPKILDLDISGGIEPYSYLWEPEFLFDNPTSPNPTIFINSPVTIQLTVTDAMECSEHWYITILVEGEDYNIEFSAFPHQFITQPFNVQFDNQTPNIVNFDFVWHFGNGDSSTIAQPNYTYTQNGLYTVTLVATNKITGCSDTLVKEDYIVCTGAGIGEIDNNDFHYYLNQENRELVFFFENEPDNLTFNLFSLLGIVQYSTIIDQKVSKFYVNKLPPGVYLFNIIKNNQTAVGKIIIPE